MTAKLPSGLCLYRGHDHETLTYNGNAVVGKRQMFLCRLAGRYLPRSSCDACVQWTPANGPEGSAT